MRILVVDDDVDVTESLCDVLDCLGHEPRCCYTGEEALSMCQETDFHIVFMDVRMPGISGFEATRQLQERHPGLAVCVLTGNSLGGTQEELEALDLEGLIRKPVDPAQLLAVLQRVQRRCELGKSSAPEAE